ncbi:outer membrane protein assembly factor BamB family protein [Kitasatospora sp. NPDC054939]
MSGGADRPGPGRRRLLLGGGAVLAGAALWAFTRAGSDTAGPRPPLPPPTRLAGPEPLWTYRGRTVADPERMIGRPELPVHVSADDLVVLDPGRGTRARTLPAPSPDARPGAGRLLFGADRVFTSSNGHVDVRHLTGTAADWSAPLPEGLEGEPGGSDRPGHGDIALWGCDEKRVYGCSRRYRATGSSALLFAIGLDTRSLDWSRPLDPLWQPLLPVGRTGGSTVVRAMKDGRYSVLLLDQEGGVGWEVPAGENLNWYAVDRENVYLPVGLTGLRALGRARGEARWSVAPGPGEDWRCLPPLAAGDRVYLPRDNGLLTAHAVDTGAELWSARLPFRLDARTLPLLSGSTLFVPGPAAAGVTALDADTGRERWTFRDSATGVGVWSLTADAARLYAGHDDVLHALSLS